MDGIYVGLSAGGAAGNHDTRFLKDIGLLPANAGIFDDQSGFVAGGHVGFGRQFGLWTVGLEAHLLGTTIEGAGSRRSQVAPDWTVHTEVEVNWLATGIARVGYLWGSTHLFAKGGVAVMHFDMNGYTTNLGTRVSNDSSSDFAVGWTAGIGAEWAMADRWSARLDYDYVDFDLRHSESGSTSVKVDARQHIGRVGFSYALDWGR